MRHTILVLALVSLLVPGAASTWYVGGTFEPDTEYDTAAWMFQDPPPSGSSRVYFNVITMTHQGAGASPNVGILHTRNEAPTSEFHFAVFGVWKDCNADGYIGAAEQALREYPAALLASTAACPAFTGSNTAWTEGAHNYNGWVSEYVPIAQRPSPTPADKRVYRDDEAMVWGDFQRPDERITMRSCALTPQPRGTYATTGGALNYVECRLEQKSVDGLGTFNTVVGAAGGDPLGLRFADTNDARSGPVGRLPIGGHESDAHSPATVWDCGGGNVVRAGDLLNQTAAGPIAPSTVHNVLVRAIDPRVGNTNEPSLAALVNHTREGSMFDDCNTSNDVGGDVYGGFEADFNGVDPNRKTEAEWNFDFASGGRGERLGVVLGPGSAGAPTNDGGVGWLGYSASGWYSNSVWASKTGPSLVRTEAEGASIAPAYYLSFYAHVGAATKTRGFERPVGIGNYGSYHCGENLSGIQNGWNCDATAWYRNADGSPYVLVYPHARPGQAFEFRDVDCYDGSNDLGIHLGLPAYGNDPCV